MWGSCFGWVAGPPPGAAGGPGGADGVMGRGGVLPPLQWTVKVVEPVLSQSPASLDLFPVMTRLTEPGGAGVTDETVLPAGQAGRLTAVSTPSGTVGSWCSSTVGWA